MKIEGFNLDAAVGALASIEENEGAHDQTQWAQARADIGQFDWDPQTDYEAPKMPDGFNVEESCHTAKCMAGWVLANEGIKMNWTLDDWTDDTVFFSADETVDGVPIERVARRLLSEDDDLPFGGGDGRASITALFDVDNSLNDLYAYVADYSGQSIEDVRLLTKHEIERREVERRALEAKP